MPEQKRNTGADRTRKAAKTARASARIKALDRMIGDYQVRNYELWRLCVIRRARILVLMRRARRLVVALAAATALSAAVSAVLAYVLAGGSR